LNDTATLSSEFNYFTPIKLNTLSMLLKNLSDKLNVSKIQKEQIYSNEKFESLIVTLEKGMEVPAQPAPANAGLYLISGELIFDIEGETYTVKADDFFSFNKDQMHGLKAIEDSKFLISRILPE